MRNVTSPTIADLNRRACPTAIMAPSDTNGYETRSVSDFSMMTFHENATQPNA